MAADSSALGADGAVIGGGLTVDFERVSLYLTDSFHVGRSNYSENSITGGVRVNF